MKSTKTIGHLLITGAIAVLIPYTLLTIIFEYPDILRKDTASILTRFHEGGHQLIWAWFAFALAGLPLIPGYILLGQQLEKYSPWARVTTTLGVIGLIVQLIGLLRWTFVVPVLATDFVNASDAATKAAAISSFKTIHQFGGVLLGEQLGQLFTISWTILISLLFLRFIRLPKWVSLLGLLSAFIYLLAQAELLATVMPGIPVWEPAGFIGGTLWLIWLMIVGVFFIRRKMTDPAE